MRSCYANFPKTCLQLKRLTRRGAYIAHLPPRVQTGCKLRNSLGTLYPPCPIEIGAKVKEMREEWNEDAAMAAFM